MWKDNYRVYGVRKLWEAARCAGLEVGHDQVARLMRAEGIEGVRRTKRVRTTRPEQGLPRHPDLVGRSFTAAAPNQLWVTDLTFVPTWAEWPTCASSSTPTRAPQPELPVGSEGGRVHLGRHAGKSSRRAG